MTRYARIDIAEGKSGADLAKTVERYLPSGYHVAAIVISDPNYLLIAGEDHAGWTLDGYILPRLASGLIFGREITEDELHH